MTVSRTDVKTELATLFGSIIAYEEFHTAILPNLEGKSPIGALLSASSFRLNRGPGSELWFDLSHYVVLSIPEDSWTPAMAEAKGDELEAKIAALCQSRPTPKGTGWRDLAYRDQTFIQIIPQEKGVSYYMEIIPLKVEVIA